MSVSNTGYRIQQLIKNPFSHKFIYQNGHLPYFSNPNSLLKSLVFVRSKFAFAQQKSDDMHRHTKHYLSQLHQAAADCIRENKSFKWFKLPLLEYLKKHPTDENTYALLLNGNSRDKDFIINLYQKAKNVSEVNILLSNLALRHLLRNGHFDEAFKIFKEQDHINLSNIGEMFSRCKDEQTLHQIWNITDEKIRTFAVQDAKVIWKEYITAFAKFNYEEALRFVLSLEERSSEHWIPLFEVPGDKKDIRMLHGLLHTIIRDRFPLKYVHPVLFIALAKIYPWKVFRAFQGKKVTGATPEENFLLQQITSKSLFQINQLSQYSIYKIPMIGFLANDQLKLAEEVILFAEDSNRKIDGSMYLCYFESIMARGLLRDCVRWMRVMASKDLYQVQFAYRKVINMSLEHKEITVAQQLAREASVKGVNIGFMLRQKLKELKIPAKP
ncbi:hypothetical protein NEOLI_001809 [Neolecta irregularis DAH-3]|uniref:Uncharacterized protein n=1 Tax=Neolecta irregularis (strain DAH-3) TaxID=1198029 RepID=A0A1U7LPF3_NEOID|nr:hypothetical protein NEOLI_001809 [Neolecta irregularis DAH-3]|eukprot:OLL24546.1 hypothetical protein NEOLI_001809 [Neolecta irregularis DAH-3]